MRKIKLLLISFTFVFIFSCEKEIEVEIPDNSPKIVLSTHIGAGDSLNVFISASTPVNYSYNQLDNSNKANAVVEISNDEINWKKLNFNNSRYLYSLPLSSFNPVEGQTYYVRAALSGYKSVKCNATIPYYSPIMINLIKADTIINQSFDEKKIRITIKFRDVSGIKNYYAIKAFYKNNEMVLNQDNFENWIFNDNSKDGNEYVFYFEQYLYSGFNQNTIRVRLYQTNEAFYLFHNSYHKIGFENPFSEPVLVYSNIENGLGICSAYTYRDYYFTLP